VVVVLVSCAYAAPEAMSARVRVVDAMGLKNFMMVSPR
jgi:hypothetical protein